MTKRDLRPARHARRWIPLAAFAAASFAALPASHAQSSRPGVGAIPYFSPLPAGTTFRVWAPNASAVRVAGTFNGWSMTANPLVSEGNGYWSADVPFAYQNAQYKFVITGPAGTIWKADARARRMTNSVGNSVIYNPQSYSWTTTNYATPNFDDLVLYEMHIGTFGQHPSVPAPISKAKDKLDYLEDLGVNCVALMPFAEFAGSLSWGYNPAHPFAFESAYGHPDDLKAFVDAAHARGIAVIGDMVYNHFGPSDLDLWRYDGWSQNNGGGIYFYQDFRANTPWGPRPDFGRGEVRSFIRDNMMYWLDEFRLDGHRIDGTKFIRLADFGGPEIPEGWSLLQWLNNEVNALSPWKIMIAEDMDANNWITRTTGEGGAGFDSQWDTAFVHPVRGVIEAQNDSDRSMWTIRDAVTSTLSGGHTRRVIYTESHDEVANGRQRVPEAIWPGNAGSWYSKKRSTLGAALVFTTPGIPMLFQGQEFLEDGWFTDADPLDWSKATTYAGIKSMYRDLIRLRRNLDGVSQGLKGASLNFHHVNDGAKVVAFHRWQNGGDLDDVVVVMNFTQNGINNYRIGMPRGGMWRVRFNSDWNGYDPSFSNWGTFDTEATTSVPWDGMPASALVNIGPYSTVILSQGEPPPPPNPADVNGDGMVDGSDLAAVLGAWGTGAGPADVNGDGVVNAADLAALLAAWGPVK
jgi:1,4-alpha-glucan branching enzyme